MQEFLKVTGIVIGVFPQSEYDRRIILLTRECGKITAFVKGARRQGSRFLGITDLFCFGTFELFVGKNSYNVQNAEITNYFEFLRTDLEAAYYGMYFLELADYYALENNDESMLILLLYRALQGLKSTVISNTFVRTVFELKLFMLEGEFIPLEKIGNFNDEVYSAIDHIQSIKIEDLYRFRVSDETLNKLFEISEYERKRLVDKKLPGLEILETMV